MFLMRHWPQRVVSYIYVYNYIYRYIYWQPYSQEIASRNLLPWSDDHIRPFLGKLNTSLNVWENMSSIPIKICLELKRTFGRKLWRWIFYYIRSDSYLWYSFDLRSTRFAFVLFLYRLYVFFRASCDKKYGFDQFHYNYIYFLK